MATQDEKRAFIKGSAFACWAHSAMHELSIVAVVV